MIQQGPSSARLITRTRIDWFQCERIFSQDENVARLSRCRKCRPNSQASESTVPILRQQLVQSGLYQNGPRECQKRPTDQNGRW